MIIIGLLIGGIFSGMKLIENANAQKVVQDIKSIESGVLTFRDTYRALPGDIRNPSTRIPNCAAAPCSTGGNGDRMLGLANVGSVSEALTPTNEKFLFWQHLHAAELVSLGLKNTTDMEFGEGSPAGPFNGGYRIDSVIVNAVFGQSMVSNRHMMLLTGVPFEIVNTPALFAQQRILNCHQISMVDLKMDDFKPRYGKLISSMPCLENPADPTGNYSVNNTGASTAQYLFNF